MHPEHSCCETLNDAIPDSTVLMDLEKVLKGGKYTIEFDEGPLVIPVGCKHDLIQKAFVEQRFGIGFGMGGVFRIDIALGGVEKVQNGIVYANHGFSTIWYSNTCVMLTIDFHKHFVR